MKNGNHWEGRPIATILTFSHKHGGIVAGVAAARLIVSDPYRVALIITNDSPNTLYIGVDNTVSAANGISLPSGSEPLTINDDRYPGLAGHDIWVLASAATSDVGYIATRLIE